MESRKHVEPSEKVLIGAFVELHNELIRRAHETETRLIVSKENPEVLSDPDFNFELGGLARDKAIAASMGAILMQHTGSDLEADLQKMLRDEVEPS